jgi:hypothetical protein
MDSFWNPTWEYEGYDNLAIVSFKRKLVGTSDKSILVVEGIRTLTEEECEAIHAFTSEEKNGCSDPYCKCFLNGWESKGEQKP